MTNQNQLGERFSLHDCFWLKRLKRIFNQRVFLTAMTHLIDLASPLGKPAESLLIMRYNFDFSKIFLKSNVPKKWSIGRDLNPQHPHYK
jgi:hypothetical protein